MNSRMSAPTSRSTIALATTTIALMLSWQPAQSLAQTQNTPSASVQFRVTGPSERLEMIISTSRILTFDKKVPKILVNNPDVVRASPLSPNQVQVSALKTGVTQLNVWDIDDSLHTVDIIVSGDARELENLLKAEFPDAALRIRPLTNSVVLSGFVPRAEMVSRIIAIASDYYANVVNNIRLGGEQQIMLHCKVMEVSRTKLRAMGFDWANGNGNDFVTQDVSGLLGSFTQATASAVGSGGDTVAFGILNGSNAFFGFVEGLREYNLVKVLAEPTVTTISGRPASFSVGGEFPIAVPQSLGVISVEYRQFGTRVDVVPIVLGNGKIRLEVRPEVSEIDPSRSVILQNITIPGLRTRWVDTAVELSSGQTLALAGLIQTQVEAQNRGIPWLSDLPWIGAAFRRVQEQNNEIELLIMVTPEFVGPLDPHEVPPGGPGQLTTSPSDIDLFFRGYLEVPKCCNGRGCGNCGHGRGKMVAPGVELVPVAAPQQASSFNPHNRVLRSSPQKRVGALQTKSGQRRSITDKTRPVLIGPIGYDVGK